MASIAKIGLPILIASSSTVLPIEKASWTLPN